MTKPNAAARRLRIPGLFITGTDTGVGKTYVTSLIARELGAQGMRVGVYKPACSGSVPAADGSLVWHDLLELAEAAGGGAPVERICPQRFHAPLAPPVAARLEGRSVDASLLREGAAWWENRADLLLIEGVGGLLCPLTDEETVADLAGDFGCPLIVVARWGLGTINHTLLTIEAAQHRGLTVAGVILNEPQPGEAGIAGESNPAEIAHRSKVPILGVLPHHAPDGLLRNGRPIRMEWWRVATAQAPPRHSAGPDFRD